MVLGNFQVFICSASSFIAVVHIFFIMTIPISTYCCYIDHSNVTNVTGKKQVSWISFLSFINYLQYIFLNNIQVIECCLI